MKVPISQVSPDPSQPRQEFVPSLMEELENSIRSEGILVPLILEKQSATKYLIVDGERRWKIAKKLKLKNVPAEVVEKMTPTQRMIMRFHIQEQIASWSPFDKARAIYFFKKAENLSMKEISELLGMHTATIYNWLGILRLSSRSQTMIIEKRITFAYIHRIARIAQLYSEITSMPMQQIESLLISKIENRSIQSYSEISMLVSFLVRPENEKAKMQFLNDSQFTLRNLLGETPVGRSITLDRACYKLNGLNNWLLSLQRRKMNKALNIDQIKVFKRLIDTLKDFIA